MPGKRARRRPAGTGTADTGATSGTSAIASPRSDASLSPATHRALLIALLACVGITQSMAVAGLVRLPSAIFGGDLYYQMGCIRGIRASLDPMASCSVGGALPGYLPLYGTLVALFSRLTSIDVLQSMLGLAVVFKLLSVFMVYVVLSRLFGRGAALAGAALHYAINPSLIAKYTDFAAEIVLPLYYLSLILFLSEKTTRHAFYLGAMVALCGYAHSVAFIGSVLIFAIAAMLDGLVRRDPRDLAGYARGAAAVIAGGVLALGYWYGPIFVHHGHTSAHYTEWNGGPSLETLPQRLAYTREAFASLVRFDSLPVAVASVLFVAGVIRTMIARGGGYLGVVRLVTAATLLFSLHYFITQPLFRMNFVPIYIFGMHWGFVKLLMIGAALGGALSRLRVSRFSRVAEPALIAALLLLDVTAGMRMRSDERLERARSPLRPMWPALQKFVETETRPDDVFLSANELSFALSALTGRKVVVTRRAQNDAFIDMDVRNRDAALILYGNPATPRDSLLDRYRVRYVLWAEEWQASEFDVDERGNVTDYADPLLYFENAAYDAELTRAGVSYVHHEGWVDPTLRGPRYKQFPLTIVTAENYSRPDRPWHPELDRRLERVWAYEESGKTVMAIYRVKS